MSSCKTMLCSSLSSTFKFKPSLSSSLRRHKSTSRCCYTTPQTAAAVPQPNDTIHNILTSNEGVTTLMKMQRKPLHHQPQPRWFPYLDSFQCENGCQVTSSEVIEAVGPCISETRKERFGKAVLNRSYNVCLVVEGLCDFGNVSAAFRSADALGVQSVHVVSSDANKRCLHCC